MGVTTTPSAADLARAYLLDQLRPIAVGANRSATGDDAYLQLFAAGTNVVAVIPGTDLADEYVVVGAHYDHLGSACRTADPADSICNGATDNAAGVAVALDVAHRLAAHPSRRSVVIGFWDREEDGLLGSRFFLANPLVPLAQVKAYVNYDIQGANLLPSLRTSTFAIGAETGGAPLLDIVAGSRDQGVLQTTMLTSTFGEGRGDYVPFLAAAIPIVFYGDSTGRCYHTAQDSAEKVDFTKLADQAAMAERTVRALGDTSTPPMFTSGVPPATFDDAVALSGVFDRATVDLDLFAPVDVLRLVSIRNDLDRIVADGAAQFGDDDIATLLSGAETGARLLQVGPCDGFLAPR